MEWVGIQGNLWDEMEHRMGWIEGVEGQGALWKSGLLSVRMGEQCKDWGLWAVQEGCGGMKEGSV